MFWARVLPPVSGQFQAKSIQSGFSCFVDASTFGVLQLDLLIFVGLYSCFLFSFNSTLFYRSVLGCMDDQKVSSPKLTNVLFCSVKLNETKV